MKVTNPIIRGFYPDPSVCKANGKYYMVCSSFEYFPGVPLFESDDLIHWHQIGHCLTRKSQVDLQKINSSGGVFAPTIRFHDGTFYMVTTNDTYHKNFYVKTNDIYGEWSEPIFVDQDGIDPSLFFENEKAYFMSNGSDENGQGCIFQCEINIETGERLTESRPIWKGSGGRYLESPHLYRFGDWYYLTAAEGGTEYGHMITYSRGKTPYGPFEGYAKNPVLTNRNQGGHQNHIQGIGHGDLVQDQQGNTVMVCLGFRIQSDWMPYHHLGREVFLTPIHWQEDGWFCGGIDGVVKEEMEVTLAMPEKKQEESCYNVSFPSMKKTPMRWCHLREYHSENYEFSENGVKLHGNKYSLQDIDAPTFLGVRQSEFNTRLQVNLAGDAPEAGVTFYLCEDHHYDAAMCCQDGKRKVILRLTCGDAAAVVWERELTKEQTSVTFEIISDSAEYSFSVLIGGEKVKMGKARTKYLSSEVAGGFTGTVMGMYAVDEQQKSTAEFTELHWIQGA